MPKLSGPMLPPLSGDAPQTLVVLLHGYGSNGDDLIGLAPHWQRILPNALFVAPNGPEPVPGYPSGFQWFAIDFAAERIASQQKGLPLVAPVLSEFLADLWAQTGLGPQDTILAGFSQGAMASLHFGLSVPVALKAIVAFSGALVPAANFGAPDVPKPPVAVIHGDQDEVVPFSAGQLAAQTLEKAGYEVKFFAEPGSGHGIGPAALAFATDFIAALPPPK